MFDDFELISSYSRKQAIEDGVLIDVTDTAKLFGFKVPVAITDTAYMDTVEWSDLDPKGYGQSTEARLHDVLTMAYLGATSIQGDSGFFEVLRVPRSSTTGEPSLVTLRMHIGAGDTPEPVITIMGEDED